MEKAELVRKNIRMSQIVANWYEEKSIELGISQTNLMVMALAEYMKQDKAMEMMANFQYVSDQLEELRKNSLK